MTSPGTATQPDSETDARDVSAPGAQNPAGTPSGPASNVRPALGDQHAVLAGDKASEWMGISVEAVADGHATITMTLRPEMLNGFGIAHGGMVFAFADSAFAMACNPSAGSADTMTVASGVDISFLKPGIPGRLLTAVANRRQQSRRSGIYDIQVLQSLPEGGTEVIAEFRGRSRTVTTAR